MARTTTPSGSRSRHSLDNAHSDTPRTRLGLQPISTLHSLTSARHSSLYSTTWYGKYCLHYYTGLATLYNTLRTRSLCCGCMYYHFPLQLRGRVWSAGVAWCCYVPISFFTSSGNLVDCHAQCAPESSLHIHTP
ncbi:hypothetical protein FKM82_023484 [Ascaphus truei]